MVTKKSPDGFTLRKILSEDKEKEMSDRRTSPDYPAVLRIDYPDRD